MKYSIIIICLALVFLAGCDKREGEKPFLNVTNGTQPLYNVANHDTVNISCIMTGSTNLISEQQIDVTYDPAMGLFVGDGADNMLLTDANGFAQGFFKVHDGFYGNIEIKFSPNHFPSRSKTIILQAQDMPKITTFTAADTTLTLPDQVTDITIAITSHSQNINNRVIRYSTTVGTDMATITAVTDANGVAHNTFHRNSFAGDSTIRAYLDIYPEDIHDLVVHCQ